jgi:hypothetical protein
MRFNLYTGYNVSQLALLAEMNILELDGVYGVHCPFRRGSGVEYGTGKAAVLTGSFQRSRFDFKLVNHIKIKQVYNH